MPILTYLKGVSSGHSPKLFVLFFFYLTDFFIFGCAGSSLLRWLFSSCGVWLFSSGSACASHGWLLLLQSVGCRQAGFSSRNTGCSSPAHGLSSTGSVVVHELSCSTACGIFPDRGLTPCLPHWQMDSSPQSHQGSPCTGCSCIND